VSLRRLVVAERALVVWNCGLAAARVADRTAVRRQRRGESLLDMVVVGVEVMGEVNWLAKPPFGMLEAVDVVVDIRAKTSLRQKLVLDK
jgi:hypothetical protein